MTPPRDRIEVRKGRRRIGHLVESRLNVFAYDRAGEPIGAFGDRLAAETALAERAAPRCALTVRSA
jgi:hypothetical protein